MNGEIGDGLDGSRPVDRCDGTVSPNQPLLANEYLPELVFITSCLLRITTNIFLVALPFYLLAKGVEKTALGHSFVPTSTLRRWIGFNKSNARLRPTPTRSAAKLFNIIIRYL